jgi:hypothetical protein
VLGARLENGISPLFLPKTALLNIPTLLEIPENTKSLILFLLKL